MTSSDDVTSMASSLLGEVMLRGAEATVKNTLPCLNAGQYNAKKRMAKAPIRKEDVDFPRPLKRTHSGTAKRSAERQRPMQMKT
eukprot:6476911-Amphidinium_carterae.1